MSNNASGGMGKPLTFNPTALPENVQIIDASEMTEADIVAMIQKIQADADAAFEAEVKALNLPTPVGARTFLPDPEDQVIRAGGFPALADALVIFESAAAALRVALAEASADATGDDCPPVVRQVVQGLDHQLSHEILIRSSILTEAELERFIAARRTFLGEHFGDAEEIALRNEHSQVRRERGYK